MGCGDITKRQPFQELLAELNPSMAAYVARLPPDAARTGQLDRDMPEAVRPRLFSFCKVLRWSWSCRTHLRRLMLC